MLWEELPHKHLEGSLVNMCCPSVPLKQVISCTPNLFCAGWRTWSLEAENTFGAYFCCSGRYSSETSALSFSRTTCTTTLPLKHHFTCYRRDPVWRPFCHESQMLGAKKTNKHKTRKHVSDGPCRTIVPELCPGDGPRLSQRQFLFSPDTVLPKMFLFVGLFCSSVDLQAPKLSGTFNRRTLARGAVFASPQPIHDKPIRLNFPFFCFVLGNTVRLTTHHPDPTQQIKCFPEFVRKGSWRSGAQDILSNTSAHQGFSLRSTGIEQPFCPLKGLLSTRGQTTKQWRVEVEEGIGYKNTSRWLAKAKLKNNLNSNKQTSRHIMPLHGQPRLEVKGHHANLSWVERL